MPDLAIPDGRWFLLSRERDEWQFMRFGESFGWEPTSYRRHGEPYPGATERAIEEGMVIDA